jgi:hypothetical protein
VALTAICVAPMAFAGSYLDRAALLLDEESRPSQNLPATDLS